MTSLADHRAAIRRLTLADEAQVLADLARAHPIDAGLREKAVQDGADLVRQIRAATDPGLMEVFLAEYGLSTDEGVALMCLAEALLRVPDADTIDALIEDKIAPSDWGQHIGHSSSPLVNASTWALVLTGKVLAEDDADRGIAARLHSMVKRLGEPVIRAAVGRAMREMGAQFVLGQTIAEATERGEKWGRHGHSFSYDMLGEAAKTEADARAFFDAYADAIAHLATRVQGRPVAEAPGISIKLSALHPRYEFGQRDRVLAELVPRAAALCRQARKAGLGLNIDAEEADRLDLSLDVIAALLADPQLAGWDGFGVVVQAYGKRAGAVIDWLNALAEAHDRRIMVRLVKGAYWDAEVKRAQVDGLAGYPVFTRKAATDASYLHLARKLLSLSPRIYPQFATHNAHTVAAILAMGPDPSGFEFQRLHGMGETLHNLVMRDHGTRCRIYAPVGRHRDLLAYLVRRLLENGANSSFVHQIVDEDVAPEAVAADPFAALDQASRVPLPCNIFAPERRNSTGFDLRDPVDMSRIDAARAPYRTQRFGKTGGSNLQITNPADRADIVGEIAFLDATSATAAIDRAHPWTADAKARAAILNAAADLYEAHFGQIFALLAREAGKTLPDAVSELREAADFLRYYAAQIDGLTQPPRGIVTCISPWNFPLAIFTGQIAAALAAGNGVLAKPAEATPLIAALAVSLLHEAGVPQTALQLLPGAGATVGAALTADPRVGGVIFTGSTATAQAINRSMAAHLEPAAPLVAETGGLNAMMVDSTALPEQAVRDIIASAFQSAGQRCSALRVLYLQEDVAETMLTMLFGAMDMLTIGDPWHLATDIGPVIDDTARARITAHIDAARAEGRVMKELACPATGTFVPPTVLRVGGIEDLAEEIFGPVLHVATFSAQELPRVYDAINASGYGLTFGLHSRIDDRVAEATEALRVGNLYINRNQIGAVVGSQPFGGEGLSGTGPKAGGPAYVPRLAAPGRARRPDPGGAAADPAAVQAWLDRPRAAPAPLTREDLPGPTGEANRLSTLPRGPILCLGPSADAAAEQAQIIRDAGGTALAIAPGATRPDSINGRLDPAALTGLSGFDGVALWSDDRHLRDIRQALAARPGPILPLLAEYDLAARVLIERHLCIDTTAAGGNTALLAEMS